MISPQVIDRIFDVAAIEEVVGEYVNLKKAGSGYRGLCPFHDDKNPSMSVSPAKGIFKCFSCGTGGNVIQFIMEHEGLSYPLAVKFLADKYQIPVEEGTINVSEIEEEARLKDGIYACLEFAKNYFMENLNSSDEGVLIYRSYLKERGIRTETLQAFNLGLSGLDRRELLEAGLKQGYTVQQLFQAGLVKKIKEEEGIIEQNLRDTFIDRIVFPIHNISGKVLGFGGRIIRSDVKAPKYLNSPETLVYEKRKELYGLYQAKNQVRKDNLAYLVEGYMDVISLSQAGIENVVAVSGTAFTEEQARLLKRFCSQVTMLFDGDEAGINASLKHIHTLLKADFNVKIVLFEEGEDPDSFVSKHGQDAFTKYIAEKEQNFVEFILDLHLKGSNDPIKKSEAARAITQNLAYLKDPLKRTAFLNQAAKLLEWDEQVLINETNKQRVAERKQGERIERFNMPQAVEPVKEVEDKTNYQEKDLLKSLILYADRPFDEEQTVAEYLFTDLEEDGIWPESEPYNHIFREAYEHFMEHHSLNELFFIRNPRSSSIAADVLAVKYQLSDAWEKNYEKFVPTEEKNYKKQIIENLNYLKLHRIEEAIRANQEELRHATEDDVILNHQRIHQRLQELRQKITDEIGAVVLR